MYHPISIETEQFRAEYDSNNQLLVVAYNGVLTPAVTKEFYAWLIQAMTEYPKQVQQARGSIYNFCDVTKFDNSNLTTASNQSKQLNQINDLKDHPVALIVKDKLQQQILKVAMKLTPHDKRVRVVWSMNEAIEHVNAFHKQYANEMREKTEE